VKDWDMQFGSNYGSGHRGIDVAHNSYAIRLFGCNYGFEPRHDLSGLLRMRARSDVEMMIGRWQAKVVKEVP